MHDTALTSIMKSLQEAGVDMYMYILVRVFMVLRLEKRITRREVNGSTFYTYMYMYIILWYYILVCYMYA